VATSHAAFIVARGAGHYRFPLSRRLLRLSSLERHDDFGPRKCPIPRSPIGGPTCPGSPASGDDQTKTKFGCVAIEQVTVAFGPPAGCDVVAETAHRSLRGVLPNSRPHRRFPDGPPRPGTPRVDASRSRKRRPGTQRTPRRRRRHARRRSCGKRPRRRNGMASHVIQLTPAIPGADVKACASPGYERPLPPRVDAGRLPGSPRWSSTRPPRVVSPSFTAHSLGLHYGRGDEISRRANRIGVGHDWLESSAIVTAWRDHRPAGRRAVVGARMRRSADIPCSLHY
jgi:hypothetical protein